MTGSILRIAALALVLLIGPRAALAAEPNWPQSLVIGTASPGGTYNAYGEGLARLLTRQLGLPVTARATEGPNQNLELLESGEIQLAFVTLGVALQGWSGAAPWTNGKQYRAGRALFPMYDTPFQFMAPENSSVRSIADLNGKVVGIGPRGGTTSTYAADLFKALKLQATFVNGDWADLASQVEHGKIDAMVVAAGAPFPAFMDLEKRRKARYLALSPQEITALRLAMPEFGLSSVPAGLYPSLAQPYQTIGLYNFAIGHRDLPEGLVYRILDEVFNNQAALIEAHPAAAETRAINFQRNSFLPFHIGANEWYASHTNAGVGQGD